VAAHAATDPSRAKRPLTLKIGFIKGGAPWWFKSSAMTAMATIRPMVALNKYVTSEK
jgi:hypothetical protein